MISIINSNFASLAHFSFLLVATLAHGSKKRAPSQPDVSATLDSLDATDGVNALELKGSNTAAAKAQMAKFKKLFNIRTDTPYA